jgi:putative methionine-R-sulfoxide reductase with GAF domain
MFPVKSLAALAISQQLHRARDGGAAHGEPDARAAALEFQERIHRLTQQTEELEEDNRRKADRLSTLSAELESLDRNTSEYKQELERVKISLAALEEQTMEATVHLDHAYTQLTGTQVRLEHTERTLGFLKEVFQYVQQEHDAEDFPKLMVQWFCRHFDLGRCSLMLLDGGHETLSIAAQQGIDPGIADGIRVRVGQGVAGWVAHHRRPLLVRAREDDSPHTGLDSYNSDSFISVPLAYNNRLYGVMNLSNKRDGEPFEEVDLERALMAASLVGMVMGAREAGSESVEAINERIRAARSQSSAKLRMAA